MWKALTLGEGLAKHFSRIITVNPGSVPGRYALESWNRKDATAQRLQLPKITQLTQSWIWKQVLICFQKKKNYLLHWGVKSCTMRWLCVHSRSVMSSSFQPHGLQPNRLSCPWNFPGKNTGVGCYFLLQGIFPTQGSNPRFLHSQADSLPLKPPGKPQRTHLNAL